VEERTDRDRAFHVNAAADWKDRSPMVEQSAYNKVIIENLKQQKISKSKIVT